VIVEREDGPEEGEVVEKPGERPGKPHDL